MPKQLSKSVHFSKKISREHQRIMKNYNKNFSSSSRTKEALIVTLGVFIFILFLFLGGDEIILNWI